MKRIFDVITTLIIGVLLIIPTAIISVLVMLRFGRPVIFTQVRPGLNGRPFKIFKFRTMTDARDANGQLLSDALRLTKFGKFLRSTSLDELPGLWSVLKGDMSLVGPRPLLMEYLPLYSLEQARRHEVRPGVTGWAQVNGRNSLSWEDKFKFDVWYVDNRSMLLDLKILLLTFRKVVCRDGINAVGDATMPIFNGTSKDKNE